MINDRELNRLESNHHEGSKEEKKHKSIKIIVCFHICFGVIKLMLMQAQNQIRSLLKAKITDQTIRKLKKKRIQKRNHLIANIYIFFYQASHRVDNLKTGVFRYSISFQSSTFNLLSLMITQRNRNTGNGIRFKKDTRYSARLLVRA